MTKTVANFANKPKRVIMEIKRSDVKNVFQVILLVAALFWTLSFANAFADTIIDNGDPGTSFTGTWQVSGAADPWDPADSSATSLWSRDGDTYTWTFTPTDSGYHDFSMWWTEWPSRSSSVPVTISYWGGTDTLSINQQQDGGQWNLLNSYPFKAGENYNITITSVPGGSQNYSTNADAVEFVYRPDLNVSPVATIDSISPNPALTDALVTFTGHGDDLDGTISGYSWDSSLDGHLGDSNTFTLDLSVNPLTPGTHTISFKVVDNNSTESAPVTQTLIVQDTINEVIIDNGDPETSFTGTWLVSGGPNPWNPDDPSPTSLYSRDGDSYTWTFTPSVSGNYEFSMWWTQYPSRSPNIPVTIEYSGGTDTVTINQQTNGGQWNTIKSYPFIAGEHYNITVTAVPGGSQNYSTCADAVRFVHTGSINELPVATIDSINPKVVEPGDPINFHGSGVDNDGTVENYEWFSDIDGDLSNQDIFSTNSLTQGTHTIFFRVQDDQGAWSKYAVALVVVRDCDSPVTIMPLGNSITYGIGEISDADLITGYRQPLFQSLKSSGYYFNFVGDRSTGLLVVPPFDIDHQGYPGITAEEVADNVYNWLLANPPEIVLLHIGTNDDRTDTGGVERILDEIDRYEADQGKEVTVVLARIINRMTNDPDTTTFNNNVQAMADARIAAGDKIVIVDQESALNYPADMWDTWHPLNSGYNKMAGVWASALVDLLPACSEYKPFIFTTPIVEATVGNSYTYNVGALGNPSPSYSLLAGAPGMSIDPNTGEITWTPAAGQQGFHEITVQAQNSAGAVTQDYSINVTEGIIIDNGDPETSFTGTWLESGGPNPWDPADSTATSLWSRDGATYTWTFIPPVSGDYEFSMWWTQYPSRGNNIPVSIQYSGGTDAVNINQQVNGGQWNLINTYSFDAGVSYNITITSVPGGSQNFSTCADAVKFVLASATSPSITSQPSNQTVFEGQSATFSVAASGTAPMSYQWQKNGSDISGATGATYIIPACSIGDTGVTFRCVVTNTAGSATSNSATLTVNEIVAPTITGQPSDLTVTEGQAATFSVTATGTAPLSYQWQRNGSDIPGATGAAYTIPATVAGDNGAMFRCVVTNTAGSVPSDAATLTVNAAVAPSITGQPSDQSVTEGQPASFSVTADGTSPLSYQWQRGGSDIPGATGATYTIPVTALSDTGAVFRCVVSNVKGSVTSSDATLTVNEMVFSPSITTQPSDQTVFVGESASFSVTATGTAPLSYQWQRGGSDISGATGATYTIPATALSDNGAVFRCVVTNTAGSITSNNATLSVVTSAAPVAVDDDADTVQGKAVTINVVSNDTDSDGTIDPSSVTITSGPANGTAVEQGDGTVLYTPDAEFSGKDTFTYTVQDDHGVLSNTATVTIAVGIVIDNGDPQTSFTGTWGESGGVDPWDPDDSSATSLWSRDGDTYTWTFTPTVSGDYEFSMWWTQYVSRSPNIPVAIDFAGGTDNVNINQQVNGGQWNIINTYSFEAGVSYNITVTAVPGGSQNYSTCADAVKFVLVSVTPPSITSQPLNQTVTEGQSASFSVTAGGSAPLSYQWQKDGSDMPGATGATYTTPAAVLEDDGAVFRCVIANAGGSAMSNDAILTVNAAVAPAITTHPLSQTVTEGQTASFSVAATGTAPLSYQWQKNGSNIPGATGAAYTTPATVPGDSGAVFHCVVSNVKGSVTSNDATLTVNEIIVAPSITNQPSDQTVLVGETASFSVTATGTAPLSYQWQKNDSDIPGATGAAYTTPATALSDNGATFHCIVSNTGGQVTSSDATLSVVTSDAPIARNDSMDTSVGVPVTIDVAANDTDSDGTIDPSSVAITSSPANGTAAKQVDGTVLYTPNAGYSGKDTFTYTVRDDQGVLSNTATVTVTVGIIIDNGDPETSFTGTWDVSGGADPWNPSDSGATSLWSRDGATYTWTFTPEVSGNYQVSMWHTHTASRADEIPVEIENWHGTTTINVNQQRNEARWNNLGTYSFEAGTSYRITITAVPGGTENYSTCADAVRFVYIPSNVEPLATIGSVSPNPVLPGHMVTFSGSGTDFEGTIVGYSWYSTLDGPLSDQPSFSTSALSEGVHTILFKVQDNSGAWSSEAQVSLDVNDNTVETTENLYFAAGYAPRDATPLMISTLQDMGATYSNGVWTYRNTARNKRYIIHQVTTIPQLINAFNTQDAVVLYNGHSNYGIGQLFATSQDWATDIIQDLRYVDDDRFLNSSSPIVHVNVNYMRTGQAYPHWWPIYKDGSSAIVPYDWGDPSGKDPAYNYYPTYQVPGDPTHYKIETVRSSAISRFPDSRVPAWYDPDGNLPDPTNPDDLQYYITNSDPWSPSYERTGNWVDTNVLTGFFRENYEYSTAGTGSNQAKWLFSIPKDGDYNVYAWYPASSTNSTSAPYTVNHASGSTTVPVNQRLNGGHWNSLGTFHFGASEYSVVLTNNVSSGRVIADGIRVEDVNNPPETLKAHFFATNRSGPAPLIVDFRAEPIGDVDTFHWDFGDGLGNSSRDEVEHTYTAPGTYTVTYTVNGPLGTDTITKVGYIVVGDSAEPLQAEFEARFSQTGTAPSTIRFRDRSSGDIVSWEWDFDGDGVVDSTSQSPSFTYTTPGNYTVSLTVRDSDANADTITKQGFIRIVIFDTNIDNVDYPKTHYGSKTLLYRKELEVNPQDFKYARLFYGGCDTRVYYVDTFHRGIMHFSEGSAADGDIEMAAYLRAYLEGKSDYEIWQALQAIEPLFDYFDFSKPPSEQW